MYGVWCDPGDRHHCFYEDGKAAVTAVFLYRCKEKKGLPHGGLFIVSPDK